MRLKGVDFLANLLVEDEFGCPGAAYDQLDSAATKSEYAAGTLCDTAPFDEPGW